MGKKQFTRALLILCAAMITGGCGQNAESTASVNSSEINHSEASDSSYGTVTIQNGTRTVTFTQMPQKVLCCHLYFRFHAIYHFYYCLAFIVKGF